MRFKPTSFHNPYFGHGRSLPRRGYDICHSPLARRREVNSEIENSDELIISNLPESETQDEKISEATTSAPPMSRLSVDEQSLRMAALALEKKKKKNLIKMKNKKKKSAPKALLATESKPST